ncbi:uncharacterized protein LOC123566510 isoform X2 [Mercenaria mercenaria]|uniref:uncharacterized protein LOC123566510 isoform X2 n=1 Tax=Mercenaria mercenaria TaxID=6596 RepID=UPI00234F1D47|nr:uncharacterized protein LOC123566510 isoform X2 [Mercenaria mercenaria]
MGPTGSGKTTLLNIISGRQKPSCGAITVNGQTFDKRLRRRLAVVQQQDVFFSQLTLMETLQFTANIRMPESVSASQKTEAINKLVQSLRLNKCLNTVIGDIFVKGLSGGEKKRASIACELLTNPDILLLDEPTSGLDSSTAHDIMNCIQENAKTHNKLIVTSIHQPASKLYHMFDQLVLLSDGYCVYSGNVKSVLPHYEELGYNCEQGYNPADFLLDILSTEDEAEMQRIRSNAYRDTMKVPDNNSEVTHEYKRKQKTRNGEFNMSESDTDSLLEDTRVMLDKECKADEMQGYGGLSNCDDRWATCWMTQYKALAWRSLKQSIGVLKQGYTLTQAIIVSVLCSLLYFQVGVSLKTSRDVFGLIFFYVGYWTFIPAMTVISSYPAERPVITKERTSGAYRLTAYYCARITSDLTDLFIHAVIMFTLFFWVGDLGGPAEFFPALIVNLIQTFACFGVGHLLSVLCKDIRMAITTLFSYLISMYLLGGFFSQHVPAWMEWIKYASLFYYPYAFTISLMVSNIEDTPCNQTKTEDFPRCIDNTTLYVTSDDILQQANVFLPPYVIVLIILAYTVLIRLAAYCALRFKKETLV